VDKPLWTLFCRQLLDAAPAPGPEKAAQGEEQKNDDDQQNEHAARFLSVFHPGAGLSLTTQMICATGSPADGCAFPSSLRPGVSINACR
jgi:hypothetical protein